MFHNHPHNPPVRRDRTPMRTSPSRTNTLIAKRGSATARLAAYGVGPLAPLASGDSEEGRAKNRCVELVKR